MEAILKGIQQQIAQHQTDVTHLNTNLTLLQQKLVNQQNSTNQTLTSLVNVPTCLFAHPYAIVLSGTKKVMGKKERENDQYVALMIADWLYGITTNYQIKLHSIASGINLNDFHTMKSLATASLFAYPNITN